MKIGILTFHWATNYGAIMQCYALQCYLESIGHVVKVINYKPYRYDDTFFNFLRDCKFLNLTEYLNNRKKEKELISFRNKYLNLTKRIYSCVSITHIANQFDIIISGSDQVVNPFFLMSGEGRDIISPTYYIGFPFQGKRIGYALSFGCVTYPENAYKVAADFINDFDVISVREKSGIDIVKSMGRNDAFVVPDPTLLMNPQFYHNLADECSVLLPTPYIYNFFIRHISERKRIIRKLLCDKRVIWNNDDGDYSIQGWLYKIKCADFVITDSFHCAVMCLKLHKPFVIITELKGNVGMNDRFYTLLDYLGLRFCIMHKEEINKKRLILSNSINWDSVDKKIEEYALSGKIFLAEISYY